MTRISKMTLLLLASAGWLRAQEGAPSGPTRTLDEGVGVSVNALGAQHTYDLSGGGGSVSRPISSTGTPTPPSA